MSTVLWPIKPSSNHRNYTTNRAFLFLTSVPGLNGKIEWKPNTNLNPTPKVVRAWLGAGLNRSQLKQSWKIVCPCLHYEKFVCELLGEIQISLLRHFRKLHFNMHGCAVAYSYLLCTLACIIIVTFTVYIKLCKHCEMTWYMISQPFMYKDMCMYHDHYMIICEYYFYCLLQLFTSFISPSQSHWCFCLQGRERGETNSECDLECSPKCQNSLSVWCWIQTQWEVLLGQ